MTEWGRYVTVGPREYRGHPTGEEFIARLEQNAMRRAVQRGDIQLIERVTPQLPPEWGLPAGWPNDTGKE